MIQYEQVEDGYGILHAVKVSPAHAPTVVLYVVLYRWRYYVVRQSWRRPPMRPDKYFSKHVREDLAIRAALRRARLYEEAYSVDRSRGRFSERR